MSVDPFEFDASGYEFGPDVAVEDQAAPTIVGELDSDFTPGKIFDQLHKQAFDRGEAARAMNLASPTKENVVYRYTREPLHFDLETIPDYSRLESFGLEPLPPVPEETDPSSLPDREKIIAGTAAEITVALSKVVAPSDWLDGLAAMELAGKNRSGVQGEINKAREARQRVVDMHDDRRKLLSTTPEFCTVAAMGWAQGSGRIFSAVVGDPGCVVETEDGEGEQLLRADDPVDERQILQSFWRMAATCSPLVGFNILSFDLLVIIVRSVMLDVPASRIIDLSPFGREVCDMYAKRFGKFGNTDKRRPGTLKRQAAAYGIAIPAGDFNGSMVEEAMKTGDGRNMVGRYVRSDVRVAREYHAKLSGYLWV